MLEEDTPNETTSNTPVQEKPKEPEMVVDDWEQMLEGDHLDSVTSPSTPSESTTSTSPSESKVEEEQPETEEKPTTTSPSTPTPTNTNAELRSPIVCVLGHVDVGKVNFQ